MKIKTGNLLAVGDGVIAHGCNAKGVMGSGVAKLIRDTHPLAYEKYREAYEAYYAANQEDLPLGGVQWVQVTEFLIIANCLTQQNYGRDEGTRYVSYDAVDQCFEILAEYSATHHMDVNFPLIGGGLGNGDPAILKAIFERHFPGDNGILWLPPEVAQVELVPPERPVPKKRRKREPKAG